MSYEPPIEIETNIEFPDTISELSKAARAHDEQKIVECVRKLNISIDKEELLKALSYDREQYDEGYADGYADGTNKDTRYAKGYEDGYTDGKKDSVVYAHWEDNIDGITPYCSNCGRTHSSLYRTPDYCPHCGAKMGEVIK